MFVKKKDYIEIVNTKLSIDGFLINGEYTIFASINKFKGTADMANVLTTLLKWIKSEDSCYFLHEA